MKILLAAVALLVAIETEAHPGWSTYPDFQDQRGNNPGRGWGPPRIEQQNNRFTSDIEWVCQNPKTNDIVCTYKLYNNRDNFEILKLYKIFL